MTRTRSIGSRQELIRQHFAVNQAERFTIAINFQ